MKDITVLVPVYDILTNELLDLYTKCFNSIVKNKETYKEGKVFTIIIGPSETIDSLNELANKIIVDDIKFVKNDKDNDFCTQVNYAVKEVKTEYFSILEFDDEYSSNWFKMANEYFIGNESVSLFLPINVINDGTSYSYQFANEVAWAGSFSNEIGYIDYDCLLDYNSFNITGGIFNTKDFTSIGSFKPSMKMAFAYEFMLRLTNKGLKIFVVPKEGYKHLLIRKDSITDTYNKTMSIDTIQKYFELAKIEYSFDEDRGIDVSSIKNEKLK